MFYVVSWEYICTYHPCTWKDYIITRIVIELLQNVMDGSPFFWEVVLHDGWLMPNVLRQHVGHIFKVQKSMKNGHFWLLKMRQCCLKLQAPMTQRHGTTSQKNRDLNCTTVEAHKQSAVCAWGSCCRHKVWPLARMKWMRHFCIHFTDVLYNVLKVFTPSVKDF
jgi:hypothetical protein